MNNWKLRATYSGDNTMDFVEVNGYLASPSSSEPQMKVVPFGDKYAAALRKAASETFGPVSNQVPGICNGTFTHTGSGSATVSATTLTGSGSSATFTYSFLADGTLSTIVAAAGGSNYKVGDKLRITTSAAHGSQVIEFRLVDGSNGVLLTVRLIHDRNNPLPFPVHRARVNESSSFTFQVLDYRGQQVFPRPQDKLLDKYPNAAAAYGLRKLRSAYLGPAIQVRRASDNASKDIYFDSQGNLDTADLVAFAGGSSFIRTWYDQSGNGNDALQTAAASQPRISQLDGSLVTVNGKPALDFDGSDDQFSIDGSDLYGQDRLDAYMHYQTTDAAYIMFVGDTGGKYSFVPQDQGTDTALSSQYDIDGTLPTLYVNGIKPGIVSGTTDRDDLHTMMVTNAASHSNGAIMVHEAAGTQGWTDFGVSTYSGFRFLGKLTEMVLYNTDQSANRENIEKDMALHSGAYQVEDAPLLDAYGGAHAAYSLRKLNSDYTGAAIRVRATRTGSPEQDIGFDADGNLDTAALLAFTGSNSGYIKTWYDQSGNGNDVTQEATNKQPKIAYSNNTVVSVSGRPAPVFQGSAALPFDNTGLDIGNLSSFTVLKYQDTAGSEIGLGVSGGGGNKRWYSPYLVGGTFAYGYAASPQGVNTTANTNNNLHTMIAGATQTDMEAFLNGTSVGTATLATGIDTTKSGIGNLDSAFQMDGFIQEVVVYSSDQSERREGIERNISNHYDL